MKKYPSGKAAFSGGVVGSILSQENRRSNVFQKCSKARDPGSNDNDDPDHDNIVAMLAPDRADLRVMTSSAQAHRPWLVPGVAASF